SPLKSADAIAVACPLTENAEDPSSARPPPGCCSSTDTPPGEVKPDTARSSRPSPLKSPVATPLGPAVTVTGEPACCANPPTWRRYTEMLEPVPFIVATSGRPSLLKSPAISDNGSTPTGYG